MQRHVLVNAKVWEFLGASVSLATIATSSGHVEIVMKRVATSAKHAAMYVDVWKRDDCGVSAAGHRRNDGDDVAGSERVTRLTKLFTDREAALSERSAQGGMGALEPGRKRSNVGDFSGKLELVALPSQTLADGGKVEDRDATLRSTRHGALGSVA
jgi:hypothetical protein